MDTHPPFFIVGCPRSGTTLLRNLLRSHPNLAVAPESHFVPVLYRAWGEPADDDSRRRLIRRMLRMHWVRQWGVTANVSDFDGCTTFPEIVVRLYRLAAGGKAHCRMGDKTPGYAREIPTLNRIFPDSPFIHIIRDGRDVALSLAHVWFGHRHVYTAAQYWRAHVAEARRDGRTLGPHRYLELRYEDLLRDTEGTMRRVCAFLGEAFVPEVLVPAVSRRPRWRPPTSRYPKMASISGVVSDNMEKWRAEMPRGDIEIFETVAGDLLQELGYERVTRGCRITAARALAWRADEFVHRVSGYLSRKRKSVWIPSEISLAWARLRTRFYPVSAERPAMPRES